MKRTVLLLLCALTSVVANAELWTSFKQRLKYEDLTKEGQEHMDSVIKSEDISLDYYLERINVYRATENLMHAPSVLLNISAWRLNSVGGIEMDVNVTNCTAKTIKYVDFSCYFTNPVGDICYNSIGGGKFMKKSLVGPIGPRPSTDDTSESAIDKMNDCEASYKLDDPNFYNKTAETIHITLVKVTYMDGSVKSFVGKSLDNIISFEYNWGESDYNPLNCVEYLKDI